MQPNCNITKNIFLFYINNSHFLYTLNLADLGTAGWLFPEEI